MDESEQNGHQTKRFSLASLRDDYELPVVLIFSPNWPHHCSSQSSATDLIPIVDQIHRQSAARGPLVVVDRFGGTEAATFCALMTLIKQMDFENHVDVYQYVKGTHRRKPGIWKTPADLLKLYKIMEDFVQMTSYRESVEDLEKVRNVKSLAITY